MRGNLSLSSRQEIVEKLSRIVYFAKCNDVHSMSSAFSALVEQVYGELCFIPSDSCSSESDSDEVF